MRALVELMPLFAVSHGEVHDAAEEGRRIITAMLIVGLIFASIVIVGEYVHWRRHDRGPR